MRYRLENSSFKLPLRHHLQSACARTKPHIAKCVDVLSDESAPPTNSHTHTDLRAPQGGRLRDAFPLVRPVVRSSRSLQPLFLSGRPFTIGNLHKRLTEARLNHTREREKNRRAFGRSICAWGGSEGSSMGVPRSGGRCGEEGRRPRRSRGAKKRKKRSGERRKRRDEAKDRGKRGDEEGAKEALSPMEAKVYDASPAGVTDATTEALRTLFQVGFLLRALSPLSPLPSLHPTLGVHLRNTLGTRDRAHRRIPVTLYVVRRDNVTVSWWRIIAQPPQSFHDTLRVCERRCGSI